MNEVCECCGRNTGYTAIIDHELINHEHPMYAMYLEKTKPSPEALTFAELLHKEIERGIWPVINIPVVTPEYTMYKDKLEHNPSVYDEQHERRLMKTSPSWLQMVRERFC